MNHGEPDPFLSPFHGSFANMLRWSPLDTLWETRRQQADSGWYADAIGGTPPAKPLDAGKLGLFIDEIKARLQREHAEDYWGIVYVDQARAPSFIKIYDPNKLGVQCGFSDNPPLPGWVLSLTPPCNLQQALPPPAKRRRGWQQLFS